MLKLVRVVKICLRPRCLLPCLRTSLGRAPVIVTLNYPELSLTVEEIVIIRVTILYSWRRLVLKIRLTAAEDWTMFQHTHL